MSSNLRKRLTEIYGSEKEIPEFYMNELLKFEKLCDVSSLTGGGKATPEHFVDVQDGDEWGMAFVAGKMGPHKYLCAWIPGRQPSRLTAKTWTHDWGLSSSKVCASTGVRGCSKRARDRELYSTSFLIDPPKEPLHYFTLNTETMKWNEASNPPSKRPPQAQKEKDPSASPPPLRIRVGDRVRRVGKVVHVSSTRVTFETTLRTGKTVKRYLPLIEVEEGLASDRLKKF